MTVPSRLDSHLARIEAIVPEVALLAAPAREPDVVVTGRFPFDAALRARATEIREGILARGGRSDLMALVDRDVRWSEDPPRLTVRTLDYAGVTALRERDGAAPVLNAMGILVSPEQRTLVLHRRAATTEFFAGALQGVGGSYAPPARGAEDDALDLRRTLAREVREELGLELACADARFLVVRERDVGSILVVFLGARVIDGLHSPTVDLEEGDLCLVGYDDLPGMLASPQARWAPSGRAAVLAWLALGAAGAAPAGDARFGGVGAAELFERLVRG